MTDHIHLLERQAESDAIVAETELTVGFGNQCNAYVDVIQQALDLALGNTGNLAPDTAVVDALDELYVTARNAGASALLQLLVPLNQVLRSAEQSGFTLSQADTLLVQEAIIAITLGIDSIVNRKPIPGLLSDVTQRMVDVAAENKHEIRANSEATGLVNVFVSDADELLQRLFEQIQRWRASAFVGRGYEEVNRLLLTLHDGAEAAGLTSMASAVRLLLDRMRAQRVAETVPDDDFFDLATETIEVLGEDLDRIRNNEQLIHHTELYERLAVEGSDPMVSIAAYRERSLAINAAVPSGAIVSLDSAAPPDDTWHTANSEDASRVGTSNTIDQSIDASALTKTNDAIDHTDNQLREVSDVTLLDDVGAANWPAHRELVDVLREISRGNEAIRDRIEQLRRTIHVYPEARQVTADADTDLGSAVSAVDNIFFKIDSLISNQRKSVTSMASVLGVEEQQTVEALGAEMIKHPAFSAFNVEFLRGSNKVVIDSHLYDHLGYALRVMLDSILPASTITHAEPGLRTDENSKVGIVFDLIDGQVIVKIVGDALQVSEFVVANACLRTVDEQMLKTQLPRASQESCVTPTFRAGEGHNTSGRDSDLVTLAALQRLIDIAAYFQGRVTSSLKWSETGTTARGSIEMVLPVAAMSVEVVLFKSGQRLYAVPSAVIEKMESGDRDNSAGGIQVRCMLGNGERCTVRVDSVVGKQEVSVTRNTRLMLADTYSGAFIFSDSSLVLVVNTDILKPESQLELPG